MNRIQHDFDEEKVMNDQLRQNQNYFHTEMQKLKEEFDAAMKTKNQVREIVITSKDQT
jgi:hypothetical protein